MATPVITIEDYNLNLIKSVIAYPKIDTILLTNDNIKLYAVYPALVRYFTKFPIRVEEQASISTSSIVDYPDDNTIGVLGLSVVGKTGQGTSSSNFWDIIRHQMMTNSTLSTTGSYGVPGYNPNSLQQKYFDRIQQTNSMQNQLSTQDYRINENGRNINVATSLSGYLLITWAKMSLDFSDIKFDRKLDVIDLAKSELLMHLANTVGLVNDNSLEVNMDKDDLKTKADELKEKVLERWEQIPSIIFLRQT